MLDWLRLHPPGTVMNAISDACGLRTDAHGIILSLPVDEVIGLETGENTL